ncbi:RRQRL motif-containing zinc-binding protein [Streptomyces sp. NRRL WC-3742]|uniref:RRQRL motif-containing zinc-binding protein n=1 Tax=Streptomyces sp. NRRL WC-3742 TaxID=1463934 RepID=UPI0004C53970|nr:RRQRL motif-containing zinc-binding protein [Streptomyces sp. NRRL WC-3742]
MRALDLDPAGEHHGGLPTWPWRYADTGVLTRRQLRAAGLRPGGQEPAAQVVCRNGGRIAYLYRIDQALPVRPMTPGRAVALDRAMAARQTCPVCSTRYDYCLPLKTLGSCPPCAELSDDERDQLAALART